MAFEINLPARCDVYLLRRAGMDPEVYQKRSMDVLVSDAPAGFEVHLPYFLSNPPTSVSVSVLEHDRFVRLRIATADKLIERRIRKSLQHYCAENDGERLLDREHAAIRKQINAILKGERLSYKKIEHGEERFNRRSIEALMKLSRDIGREQVNSISDLFSAGSVDRADQKIVVRWLITHFNSNPDPFEQAQLSLRIEENVVPQVADELIALIENRKKGKSRSLLLLALAKTKHPRAADVIASVLDEEQMACAGLEALASLKAIGYLDLIRRFLGAPKTEVRREAKKALKKLGVPVDIPPPPTHMVKAKGRLPKHLQEWSQNLDMSDLDPTLLKLATFVDKGFGNPEIAEVVAVAEEMKPDQTKRFCFPVTVAGSPDEIWLGIFMDDIDSPDLQVFAPASIVRRLEACYS